MSNYSKKKNTLISGLLGVGLVIGGVTMFFSQGSVLGPKPPVPKETPDLPPIIESSSVFVPVKISAATIGKAVEKFTPRSVDREFPIDIGGPVLREKLKITATRAPLKTKLSANGISISGSIASLAARVSGKVDSIVRKKSFTQTVRGKVNFNLGAKPQLLKNWKIDPKLTYKFRVPKMEIKLGGIVKVSLRGITTKALNGAAGKAVTAAKTNFPLNVQLKKSATELWKKTHRVQLISEKPKAWITVKPTEILASQLNFSNSGIQGGAGLKLETSLVLQDTKPTQVVGPLPNQLTILGSLPKENLKFSIPVGLQFDALNSAIETQLRTKGIEFDVPIANEEISVNVEGLEIQPSGDGVILKLEFASKSGGFFGDRANGVIFLQASPVLDVDRKTLSFSNLNYHVDTRSALLNAAGYLLKPEVLRELQKRLRVDLSELEIKAKNEAIKRVSDLQSELPKGLIVDLTPSAIGIKNLLISKQFLQIVLTVSGKVDVAVGDEILGAL